MNPTSPKKDGGNAFPVSGGATNQRGMTMRQAYKLAALQGAMQVDIFRALNGKLPLDPQKAEEDLADTCGKIADALIAEDLAHAQREEGK